MQLRSLLTFGQAWLVHLVIDGALARSMTDEDEYGSVN